MAKPKEPINAESMPVEILQKIYEVCPSIADVIALSSTCKKMNRAFQGSRKLPIIESIINLQYGPIADAISVVTHNATNNQIALSVSLALAKQVDQVGRVANQWAELYPMEKWKSDYESRRLLTSHERYKLRRAVYRIWLYNKKFHNFESLHDLYLYPQRRAWRAAGLSFLANYSSKEAGEMLDMEDIFGCVLADICPHNGIINMRARDQYPSHQLYFASSPNAHLDSTSIEDESWGDIYTVEHLIGVLMKINPKQLLIFKELPGKRERKQFLKDVNQEYHGLFTDFGSRLPELLPDYLHHRFELDPGEAVDGLLFPGIIAADE